MEPTEAKYESDNRLQIKNRNMIDRLTRCTGSSIVFRRKQLYRDIAAYVDANREKEMSIQRCSKMVLQREYMSLTNQGNMLCVKRER